MLIPLHLLLAALPLAAAAADPPQTTEPARLEERQGALSYMWLSITNGASQCESLAARPKPDLTIPRVAAVVPGRFDDHVERQLLAVLRYRRRVLLVHGVLRQLRHELGDPYFVVCRSDLQKTIGLD